MPKIVHAPLNMPPLTEPMPARNGITPITPDRLIRQKFGMPFESTLHWLNNDQILYSTPLTYNRHYSKIEKLNLTTMTRIDLGRGFSPKSSPDGSLIAFVNITNRHPQIFLMDSSGSSIKQLTFIPSGLSGFHGVDFDYSWSPDSNYLVLYYHQKPKIKSKNKVNMPFSHHSTLTVVDVHNSHVTNIIDTESPISDVSWFHSTNKMLFVSKSFDKRNSRSYFSTSINSLCLETCKSTTLIEFDGMQQLLKPALSPNDKLIAFTADMDYCHASLMPSLCLFEIDKSTFTQLTSDMKMSKALWSHDSKTIYTLRTCGAYNQIYSIDIKTQQCQQLTDLPHHIETYTLSPRGKKLAWIAVDAHADYSIRVASITGHDVNIIATFPGSSMDYSLAQVNEISWASPDYPINLRGLLYLPLGYQAGKKYPLIVDIHCGGPGANLHMYGSVLTSRLEWHMWATKGHIVFVPDFRSSGCFGSLAMKQCKSNAHALVRADIIDIESGVDMLISKGMIDVENMTAIGFSAGARRANWLAVTSNRYKHIISRDGWSESVDLNRIEQINDAEQQQTAATLFIMGHPKYGGLDVESSVETLFNSLINKNFKAKYIQYKNDGHVLRHRKNRTDAIRQCIEWIHG